MRITLIVLSLLMINVAAAAASSRSLFDGSTLNGWRANGNPDAWSVEDGCIVCGAGDGGWLVSEELFRDFEVTVDFMLPENGNSGLGLRCATTGDPAFTGFEVQMLDTPGQKPSDTNCGAVYNAIPANAMAVKPAGEWNRYRVRLVGDTLNVWLNDQHIHVNARLDERGYRHQTSNPLPLNARRHRGHIALQDHGNTVRFRNIHITDLAPTPRVLVFSKTAGFRHGSIPTGIQALTELAREHGYQLVTTESSAEFNDENLDRFDAVVFLNTTGDVFTDEQQGAFTRFVRGGGGYLGIHAASDTEFDWPWYGELVGAYFDGHPRIQEAAVMVENNVHPSTHHLAQKWMRTDEWYNFRAVPRDHVTILLRLDTSSYEGSTMPDNHPIAWCHEFNGGRALYTAGGHTNEAYREPAFRQHLAGALSWVTGRSDRAPISEEAMRLR